MEIKTFFFNELRTCCYVLWDKSNHCIVVDPGCYGAAEQKRLFDFIDQTHLFPDVVVNTHCHFDHIMGLSSFIQSYPIPFMAHPLEATNLKRCASYSSLFGFEVETPSVEITPLSDGESISFGETSLQILHTPGHSPGSICIFEPQNGVLLSGDTLFAGSVGRTDLPGGDYDQLDQSLQKMVKILPQEVTIFPGHGPSTTLREELKTNPFLQ